MFTLFWCEQASRFKVPRYSLSGTQLGAITYEALFGIGCHMAKRVNKNSYFHSQHIWETFYLVMLHAQWKVENPSCGWGNPGSRFWDHTMFTLPVYVILMYHLHVSYPLYIILMRYLYTIGNICVCITLHKYFQHLIKEGCNKIEYSSVPNKWGGGPNEVMTPGGRKIGDLIGAKQRIGLRRSIFFSEKIYGGSV